MMSIMQLSPLRMGRGERSKEGRVISWEEEEGKKEIRERKRGSKGSGGEERKEGWEGKRKKQKEEKKKEV